MSDRYTSNVFGSAKGDEAFAYTISDEIFDELDYKSVKYAEDLRAGDVIYDSWNELWGCLLYTSEGMAVGLAFSMAAQDTGSGALAGAVALAIGMGLQNFPEGAAISLPLRSDGVGTGRAFAAGALSGVVEPIFGLLTVLVAGSVSLVMPWVLSFAAGAMIYVVVEELIPEAHLGEHSHVGTASVMCGFLVMMLLDVMLG